jgi:hypothetical protein
MKRWARFGLLLLVSSIFAAQLLSQEVTKKPLEGIVPGQTTDERTVTSSRTHCEVPSCVQKVLYFSNLSQPSELQDVVNAVRIIAEIGRVQPIPAARIIIVEGTAEQVDMAEKLAAEIDRDKRRFGGLGYRIDLKIQESEADKPMRTRFYSFLTEATARLSVEKQATAQGRDEPASENKQQPPDSGKARDIECRILAENEHTVELSVEVAFASDSGRQPDGAPTLLQVREHVTVELDKPTVISRVDDPDTDHNFKIELTATRIKDRS